MHSRILHVDLDQGPAMARVVPFHVKGAAAAFEPRVPVVSRPTLEIMDLPVRRELGQHLHAILGDFSTRIEPLALDQCWLDVTENHAGLPSATAVARRIRERIRDELGLKCAIGVAPLRYVAKIAADERRPDGLTVVGADQVLEFVRPLPVHRLWGVGPVTTRRLAAHGIATIAQLADLPEDRALELLGRSQLYLWRMANGHDPREVRPSRRSRGQERTFAVDVRDPSVLRREIQRQARDVCADLARSGEAARTVTVKVRYRDFETVTRTRTRDAATQDVERILDVAGQLLTERTEVGRRPVRLVGVQLSGLAPAVPQLPLPFPGR